MKSWKIVTLLNTEKYHHLKSLYYKGRRLPGKGRLSKTERPPDKGRLSKTGRPPNKNIFVIQTAWKHFKSATYIFMQCWIIQMAVRAAAQGPPCNGDLFFSHLFKSYVDLGWARTSIKTIVKGPPQLSSKHCTNTHFTDVTLNSLHIE